MESGISIAKRETVLSVALALKLIRPIGQKETHQPNLKNIQITIKENPRKTPENTNHLIDPHCPIQFHKAMPANKRRARQGTNANGPLILKPNPVALAADHLKAVASVGAILANGDGPAPVLTLKEQQQLDRNAYLSTLSKDQLKVECRKRGQKNTGTKVELVLQTIALLLLHFDDFR